MPFNQKTPLGYLLTLSFECILTHYVAVLMAPTIAFLIGSCFLLKTFLDDAISDLAYLKVEEEIKSDENLAKKIRTIFCEAVRIHADLKQLSVT